MYDTYRYCHMECFITPYCIIWKCWTELTGFSSVVELQNVKFVLMVEESVVMQKHSSPQEHDLFDSVLPVNLNISCVQEMFFLGTRNIHSKSQIWCIVVEISLDHRGPDQHTSSTLRPAELCKNLSSILCIWDDTIFILSSLPFSSVGLHRSRPGRVCLCDAGGSLPSHQQVWTTLQVWHER